MANDRFNFVSLLGKLDDNDDDRLSYNATAVAGTVLWNIYYLWVIDPLRLSSFFSNDAMCFVSYVCMSFIACNKL